MRGAAEAIDWGGSSFANTNGRISAIDCTPKLRSRFVLGCGTTIVGKGGVMGFLL
jgi:hypothetical protein